MPAASSGLAFSPGGAGAAQTVASPWGVSSETGRLTDVLVSTPAFLSMVPCNAVTRDSLAKGLLASPAIAARQHGGMVRALEAAGVRCHFARPAPEFADLTFTRDAVLMSPWGWIELRPAAAHRRAEPAHIGGTLNALGIPHLARIEAGRIEGGDVCLLRDGALLIGHSGDRTDETGARALGSMFERMGWEVACCRFDPRFLHLDTFFTMLSPDCAVACPEALDDAFLSQLGRLGVGIIPASIEEVRSLGCNLLSLGDNRLLAPAKNGRLNPILQESGFEVIEVEIDQFTRCGGGVHCLTLPLAREREPLRQ